MKVSVVIPVYNAAPYLESCVASLRRLPLQQEIILVDDGSADGSSELCDRLGDRVLHQANQGVSAARNAGMQLATGDWLWFVDADDYVEPVDDIPVLSDDADFVNLGFVWEENNRTDSFGASHQEIPYNLWRCWFKREQVVRHRVIFTLGRKYAEDQEFILRYLIAAAPCTMSAMPQLKYHYTVRPGSAVTRKGMKCKKVGDILGVLVSVWWCALSHACVPAWIWSQSRRIAKTAIVTFIR